MLSPTAQLPRSHGVCKVRLFALTLVRSYYLALRSCISRLPSRMSFLPSVYHFYTQIHCRREGTTASHCEMGSRFGQKGRSGLCKPFGCLHACVPQST